MAAAYLQASQPMVAGVGPRAMYRLTQRQLSLEPTPVLVRTHFFV
jgi:hypothetical protein